MSGALPIGRRLNLTKFHATIKVFQLMLSDVYHTNDEAFPKCISPNLALINRIRESLPFSMRQGGKGRWKNLQNEMVRDLSPHQNY
jgi:hypothetical protein